MQNAEKRGRALKGKSKKKVRGPCQKVTGFGESSPPATRHGTERSEEGCREHLEGLKRPWMFAGIGQFVCPRALWAGVWNCSPRTVESSVTPGGPPFD
jgi:hypothetical protein